MDNIDNVSDLTFSQPISTAEEVTDDIDSVLPMVTLRSVDQRNQDDSPR